jgi:hypothetical protein
LAKTSYQREKRQKELARKKKKEEKKLRKLDKSGVQPGHAPDPFRKEGETA